MQALNGDSILISFKDINSIFRNILVDGGPAGTYGRKRKKGQLRKEIEAIISLDQNIDLLIITHIDDDHIAGIIKLFEDEELDKDIIKKIWFNSGSKISLYFTSKPSEKRDISVNISDGLETNYQQGNTLENLLKKYNWEDKLIVNKIEEEFYGIKITVISPTIEILQFLNDNWRVENKSLETTSPRTDYDQTFEKLLENDPKDSNTTLPNQSSISFILEKDNKRVLLTGDAHSDILKKGLSEFSNDDIEKLHFDLVKLPHHGSANNYLQDLANIIKCENYVISSNGKSHGNPNKLTFARILNTENENPTFYLNYPLKDQIFKIEEKFKIFNVIELGDEERIEI